MKKFFILMMLIFGTPSLLLAAEEYVQEDGLFKMNIPEGWRGQEMPGKVLILPPPSGAGIVIQFKSVSSIETNEEIKAKINANLENIAEYKVKPSGGSILENKEISIDGVYARLLYYSVFLKEEFMYFFRVAFVNKEHTFTIDYGNPSKEEVDKILNLVQTLKFN